MLDTWQSSIPSVSKNFAILLLILNIFIPGLGTIVMGIQKSPLCWTCVVIGILQFILIPFFFIGLIWSIWWGCICLSKSSRSGLLG